MSYEHTPPYQHDGQMRENAQKLYENANSELTKAVYSSSQETRRVEIAAVMAGMHILFEGEPGTGKTLTAMELSTIFGGEFKRIQGTPELMPSEITGSAIFNQKTQEFELNRGPGIDANIMLIDEINRAPSKTQSGLLSLMEEGIAVIPMFGANSLHRVQDPFVVMATQNPTETSQGTSPMTKALIDRFSIGIVTRAMSETDLLNVLTMSENRQSARTVANPADLREARKAVDSVVIDPANQLKRAAALPKILRSNEFKNLIDLEESSLGGARGAKEAIKLAKALAVQQGRGVVSDEDLTIAEHYTYPLRIKPTYEAIELAGTNGTIVHDVIHDIVRKAQDIAQTKRRSKLA